ncbi:Predicted DNA-binding protein, contains Ribbon-helix-helix (RHH) domain [Arboricoccus pini]|uniref:Predicted DNA-binding protein, contains Ribbon-helix-helix (RHH) domain n=1 Tax=Arboricoccus pini TaxID=1963835 RepID=A0A212RZS1_9PROT|nr:ribbon-helix-helix domain-containing protein [Arboricoccus pini]SNB78337.1 Predicted DNA-binding protein, contains Ribbon-helix-helix (RHH) domain [Arboricoccus pini]
MCRIYAGIDPYDCEALTRSVRLNGHVTSIRLERRFWAIVDDMAAAQGKSTPCFLGVLYDEILDLHGEVRNFASHLRVASTIFCSVHNGPAAIAAE